MDHATLRRKVTTTFTILGESGRMIAGSSVAPTAECEWNAITKSDTATGVTHRPPPAAFPRIVGKICHPRRDLPAPV